MKFEDILAEVRKSIDTPPLRDEEVSRYINNAMEYFQAVCPVCKKHCKNYRGMRIHLMKKHRDLVEVVKRRVYLETMN